MSDPGFRIYAGDGTTLRERGAAPPRHRPSVGKDDPAGYVADSGLRDAVNVALMLGQPLLVAGEPGTGKTQLAASIAHELGLFGPLTFLTKSTSLARDLFYRYDTLRHFHDAQHRKETTSAEGYITYDALGLAILMTHDPAEVNAYLPAELQDRGPLRSVVLVDEIDKAPRDFPNDLLAEVENASFQVRETGRSFRAREELRPVLVITSNSERNLPDAFLRRCVFYHIPFPRGEQLAHIVRQRLGHDSWFAGDRLREAITHFERVRDLPLKKKPATAELLAWLRILEHRRINFARLGPGDAEVLAMSYCVLAKSYDDREMMLHHLSQPD